MTLSRKFALVAAALLLLGLGVSASAVQVAFDHGYLTGTLATGTGLACDASVDLTGGVYTYSFNLIYTAGVVNPVSGLAPQIHLFTIENPNGVAFFNATGAGFTAQPVAGTGAISWINGAIEAGVGQTRLFSYQSYSAPMEILVYTAVENGGTYAEGETLGMGSMIPEPSSFVAILFGAAGILPVVIRRRK